MTVKLKILRLSKVAREFNVGIQTIVEFLESKNIDIETKPNTKITPEVFDVLANEFQSEKDVKKEAEKISLSYEERIEKELRIKQEKELRIKQEKELKIKQEKELKIKQEKELRIKQEKELRIKQEKELKIKQEKELKIKQEKELKIKQEKELKLKQEKELKIKQEEERLKEEKIEQKKDLKISSTSISKPKDKLKEKTTVSKSKEKDKKQIIAEKKQKKEDVNKTEPETVKKEEFVEEKTKEIVKEEIKKDSKEKTKKTDSKLQKPKIIGKVDLEKIGRKKPKPKEEIKTPKKEEKKESAKKVEITKVDKQKISKSEAEDIPKKIEKKKEDPEIIKAKIDKITGPIILGTIKLPKKPKKQKPVATSSDDKKKYNKKKKRRRIHKKTSTPVDKKQVERPRRKKKGVVRKHELSEEEIQKKIKDTLQKLTGAGKSKSSKYRRKKRSQIFKSKEVEAQRQEEEKKIIKVTEFVSASDLASMIGVPVTEIIASCLSLGLFVSINQRLDAEALLIIADEFGYEVEFVSAEVQEAILFEEKDNPEDLVERTPIVTVMGHVDHGKTKLLDYIRSANVVAGESGGITQHIGAYEVTLDNDRKITFLDTPGHEAFTAMRARGAKVTDVAIIVIAADDSIMPQTIEAINHAQAANVPIVFAINKVDKPQANPEAIKEGLSKKNILVEDWGGKYQSQEVSAITGQGIEELLDKVLLEAEMLELKGNPNKAAIGVVIESSLDKGRGYVSKVLVQGGTLRISDVILAGSHYGKVKAMFNERNKKVEFAGPSTPVQMLGLSGATQAGDQFNVIADEREARNIANKRQQLQREQGLRTQKHITLEEIGRRIAIGDFKELNIIIKGDVDGSVEALKDALLKLSTEEIQIQIIHSSVGQIIDSDVMLASASNAIIVGFQVRPTLSARRLAENEQIDIRTYSIIYTAINEIKDAMEGMLSPEIKEKIVCNIEITEIFKITKVGTVAGCKVLDGVVNRNTQVRIIRDGIVVYTGMLGSLKRFKDDVKEVKSGYECGLNIKNFNDIKVGDIIEGYEEIEIARKL